MNLNTFFLDGGRLVLVRHGNATKAAIDEDRQLSEKGVRQAAATRDYLASNHSVELIVTSIAQRAVNTVTDPRWGTPVQLPELYLSPEGSEEGRIIDGTFARLLYVPLTKYFAEPDVEDALMQWANRATISLEKIFAERELNGGTVIIGGHAVLLNALAIAIAKKLNVLSETSVALETALGEAECIEMELVEDDILHLRHLSAADLGHPAD